MADIFNEIDEELRGDQLRRLWSGYSGVLIVIAVLIVIGVAGWRGWEYYADKTARADGDRYLAASQLSAKGDYVGAEAALKGLQGDGTSGYRTLARLRGADVLVSAGDKPAALAAFDAIARESSVPDVFRGLAGIRAAYLAIDLEDLKTFEARLKPLAVTGNPWRHAARELLAVNAWKADDVAGAKSWVDQIEADAETPSDLTNRIAILSSVIDAAKKSDLTPPKPSPEVVPAPEGSTQPFPSPDTTQAPAATTAAPGLPTLLTPPGFAPSTPPASAPEHAQPPASQTPSAPAAKVE